MAIIDSCGLTVMVEIEFVFRESKCLIYGKQVDDLHKKEMSHACFKSAQNLEDFRRWKINGKIC